MSIVNVIENEDGTVSIPIPGHMLDALMANKFRIKVQDFFSISLSPIKEISDETFQEKFDDIIAQVDKGMTFIIKSGDVDGRKDVMLVPYDEEEIALLEKIENQRENS